MSPQGLQKAAQVLNVLGQQLPAIAQAADTPGVDVRAFAHGLMMRVGLPADCLPLVDAFLDLAGK